MSAVSELIFQIRSTCDADLITPRERKFRPKSADRTWGCCYVAAEALYHLWGKRNGFKPHYIRYHYTRNGFVHQTTHWFLSDGEAVLDPTAVQFRRPPDYSKAIACGFLTRQPSNRCKRLLSRIKRLRKEHAKMQGVFSDQSPVVLGPRRRAERTRPVSNRRRKS